MNRLRAFRFVARCLAPDDRAGAGRARLAREIASGRVNWQCVVEIASQHWMTLALYRELGEKGLLEALPSDLLEYFECLHEANDSRNRALLEHIAGIAVLLNEIGVEPLLLKGACNLASGLYPDPAVRFMSDMDIVVPDGRALECWDHLISAGYRTMPDHLTPDDYRRLPPEDLPDREWAALVHEGRTGELEMHRPVEWHHMLGSPSLYAASEPVALPRGQARVLDPTGRMIFTLAHAYVHHRMRFLPAAHLRDLYDVSLLLRRHGAEIEWPRVVHAFESADETNALRYGFLMSRRLFFERPPRVIDYSLRASLYWPLCLLDVANPQAALFCGLLARNAELLGLCFSRTPQGRDLRRELIRPSVYLRKARILARICIGAPAHDK